MKPRPSQDALDHAFRISTGYEPMKQEPPEMQEPDAVAYFEQPLARRLAIFLRSYPDCNTNGDSLGLQGCWNALNDKRRFP